MTVSLPIDLQNLVLAQISSGAFRTEEEVLREALITLERRQRGLGVLAEMVREAEADVAAGRVGPFDAVALKKSVRARLAEHGVTDS